MPHHGEGDDRLGMFEFQNLDYDTTVIVDPIVINTWYVALVPTDNVKAYYLIVEQTNNGAAAETIECEVTINGTINTLTMAALASGAVQYVCFDLDGVIITNAAVARQLLALDVDQSAPLETRSLGIRVRQTTAVDLVSAIIEVNLVYATLERT